jgi:hypothetical protein
MYILNVITDCGLLDCILTPLVLKVDTNVLEENSAFIFRVEVVDPEGRSSMFLQMLVSNSKTTYCHNLENYNLNIHCCEYLKSYTIMTVIMYTKIKCDECKY